MAFAPKTAASTRRWPSCAPPPAPARARETPATAADESVLLPRRPWIGARRPRPPELARHGAERQRRGRMTPGVAAPERRPRPAARVRCDSARTTPAVFVVTVVGRQRLAPPTRVVVVSSVVTHVHQNAVAHQRAVLVWHAPLLHAAHRQARRLHPADGDHRAAHMHVVVTRVGGADAHRMRARACVCLLRVRVCACARACVSGGGRND